LRPDNLSVINQMEHAMKTDTYTVSPWGFPMEVTAETDIPEPQTYTDPGCGWFIGILKVWVGGIDIYEMLTDAQIERIEAAIERQLED
jgi:hypothetical protein